MRATTTERGHFPASITHAVNRPGASTVDATATNRSCRENHGAKASAGATGTGCVAFLVFGTYTCRVNTARLITTGEAARLLGVSRQHVVDLCDRGSLPCERAPVHRRVPREAVEAIQRRRALTREESRSLWLNRAVAGRLAEDPQALLAHARRNLERLDRVHAGTTVMSWLKRWRQVIDAGPEAVMEMLTSKTPEAAELRQNSPFAGVLPDAERRRVLASFVRYWERAAA